MDFNAYTATIKFHERHGSDDLFKLFIQIINKPNFPSLANKIDKPRPDMKKSCCLIVYNNQIFILLSLCIRAVHLFPVFVLSLVYKHITHG